MGPLICAACEREILPGTEVEFVGDLGDGDQRIFTSDELLVKHLHCPPDDE